MISKCRRRCDTVVVKIIQAVFILLSIAGLSEQALGGSYAWAVASGAWDVNTNWTPTDGPPDESDNVVIDNGGVVDVGSLPYGDNLRMGPGSVTLEAGTILAHDTYIKSDGRFLQTGGLLDAVGLGLGTGASYELTGGQISVTHISTTGDVGTGTFEMTGGTYTVDRGITLGLYAGSHGEFSISSGSLSAQGLTVGGAGTGTFIQTGGSVVLAYNLQIAAEPNTTGRYELRGSTLEFGGRIDIGAYDGASSSGTFVADGGAMVGTNATGHDSTIYVNGSDSNLIGPGTYDTIVRYGSDRLYGQDGNDPFYVQFERGSLSVGGQLTVTKIGKDDFAGGKAAFLLESSVYNAVFDGLFSGQPFLGIPYLSDELNDSGIDRQRVKVVRQTGSDTYEILQHSTPDWDYCYTTSNGLGNFAIHQWIPKVRLLAKPDMPYHKQQIQERTMSDSDLNAGECSGSCTDGETKIIFYIDFNSPALDTESPDWVNISVISVNGEDNGHMMGEGQDNDDDGYDDTPRISKGVFTQSYCVPEVFDSIKGSANVDQTRTFEITVEYDPDRDGDVDYEDILTIVLARPPVLLVHGLWSNPADGFPDWLEYLNSRGFKFTLRANYSGSNSSGFASNDGVVRFWVSELLSLARKDGYAAAKVDAVGHSMGGVLMKRTSPAFAAA